MKTVITIKETLLRLLDEVINEDYQLMFSEGSTPDEKLKLLTSESMLALHFITTVEDEFSIEFEDSDIDLSFFQSIDLLANKIYNINQ